MFKNQSQAYLTIFHIFSSNANIAPLSLKIHIFTHPSQSTRVMFLHFLDHCLSDTPYPPYTCTTVTLSLTLYNNDAEVFMNFWTCMYSLHKNHIYHHFHKPPFFFYFWHNGLHIFSGDKHFSWIPYDQPLSRRRYKIKNYMTVLQLLLHVTLFNIYSLLHTYKLSSKTASQQMAYLHPFYHTKTLRISPAINKFQITSLSLSYV